MARLAKPLALSFLASILLAGAATAVVIDFEGISDLSQLEPLGVTFSPNITLWDGGPTSVLDDPSGGPLTPERGICVDLCRVFPARGSIYFAFPVPEVSIYALSGPGPDYLSNIVLIEAFDADGNSLGQQIADNTVQFERLSISAPGIRRLDLYTSAEWRDAWDQLEFVPEPSTLLLVGAGLLAVAGSGRRARPDSGRR